MPLDPNIALSYKPVEIPNALAQYAQIAQLQHYQNQDQVAQMQLAKMRQHETYLAKMGEAITKNGGPDLMTAASLMAQNPDPNVQLHGIQMLQAQQELADYNKRYGSATQPTGGYGGAMALMANGALGSGTYGVFPEPATNTLAPKTAPVQSQNALVDVDALRQKLMDLSRYPTVPAAKVEAGIIQKQLEEATKTHVVPNVGLVTGAGKTIVAAGAAPSDIKRLTDERNALPEGDPRRKIYDQAIADIGASARVAQQRLEFDRTKFAWEKANPGYELKEDADGNMFGVNKRTLQAVPVMVGGTTAAPTAPAGAGMPGARMPAPAGAPVAGTPGQQFTGKGTALTESQGNAAAYGMRMKEANAILEPLEKSGTKNTGLISGVVGGTLGLTPYLGDKLESATGSVFNALPQILGGLSPEQQQVAQARINFITAVLRKESGASISPGEFTTAEKNYFPKPGDSDAVIAQKQKARQTAIKAMEIQAGPGAKNIQKYQPATGITGATADDPLGLGVK
jgi:hypothetical protein